MSARKRHPSEKSGSPRSLIWTPGAVEDLQNIGDYFAPGSEQSSLRWVTRLAKAPNRLVQMPLSGRVVPEIASLDVREVIVGQYRIIYRVVSNTIWVLGIVSGMMKLPNRFWAPKTTLH